MGPGYDTNKSIVDGRIWQPNPYKDDKPLYRVTAQNMDQYADKLSETQKSMLKMYPKFYIDVYPSHRPVNPPQYYTDSSIKNATRCHTVKDGLAIEGCKGGTPFPIPKKGDEVMWNVMLGNYQGADNDIILKSIYVDNGGTFVVGTENWGIQQAPYHDPRYSLEDFEGNKPISHVLLRALVERRNPPRVSGETQLYYWYTDNSPVAAWAYQPGNRRVRVNPNVSYDYPLPSAGGAAVFDEPNIFQGRLDRFDWKLLGKKEMLVPYNNYKLAYGKVADGFMAGHPNPAAVRWELHRVWVVEGIRKPGARHIFAKRRYYIDEDMANGSMVDEFDDSGTVARGIFADGIWIWDYQQSIQYLFTVDLRSHYQWIYDALGDATFGGNRYRDISKGDRGGFNNGPPWTDSEFTPESLPRHSSK